MKLPWKNSSDSDDTANTDATAASVQSDQAADTFGDTDDSGLPKGQTAKKGRPTPKRNEVERSTGVRRAHYDAPLTPKEARQRKKER